KNLEFAKNNILKIQIPKLYFQKENILNVEIPKLEFKLKNIQNIEIPKLLNEAQKIKLVEIKKINDKIISYRNEITQIDNKIKVLKYNISPANIQNSRVIGGFVTKDTPAKPKKRLILAVAFVTGLIFSIFLIFILEFWEENKKRLEESQ
ncbi:MAG: chain-length determining protein, partial [Epsilonproteobacteria bacterium]|nr:chain-length determining protein [Campylobacterota bacterium]